MSCSLMMAGCVGRETQCDGRGDTVGDTVGDIAWWGGGHSVGHSMVGGGHRGSNGVGEGGHSILQSRKRRNKDCTISMMLL